MTIKLSHKDYWGLFQEPIESTDPSQRSDDFDSLWRYPQQIGQGYMRWIQLREGLELIIADYQLRDRLILEIHDRSHPLEFNFYISGNHSNAHSAVSSGKYLLYGSGVAPREACEWSAERGFLWVNVHIEPELFRSFISGQSGQLPPELNHLVRSSSQEYFVRSGITTALMQVALQQILHCPYVGLTKRMFLECKVWELTTLLIDQMLEEQKGGRTPHQLKRDDLDRIHYAREILQRNFDNPPSLLNLAHQVGLNDYKLKLGFRQVFQTTVFGYLQSYRMEKARQLIAEGDLSIGQVARAVGYSHAGYFAAAFKRKFGIKPKSYSTLSRSGSTI